MLPGMFSICDWHEYFTTPSHSEIQRLIADNIDGFRDKVVHFGRYDNHPYIELLSYLSWLSEMNYSSIEGGNWPV